MHLPSIVLLPSTMLLLLAAGYYSAECYPGQARWDGVLYCTRPRRPLHAAAIPIRESCTPCAPRSGRLGTRRTTRQGAAGQSALRPVHAARRPGITSWPPLSQVLYSHAGVGVHAAMCLALALGLAGVCLCQNCVRLSPRPAHSKLSWEGGVADTDTVVTESTGWPILARVPTPRPSSVCDDSPRPSCL